MDVGRGSAVLRGGPGIVGWAGRALATILLAGGLGLGGTACGSVDGSAQGPCGPVQREPLDPRALHILPGADPPEYRTDPPTSGPHLPSPATEPVRDEPIEAPIQVGILEEGGIVIQYVGLSASARAEVEGLAGEGVVVAPADHLPQGAAVMATAWVTKQGCDAVDGPALEAFVEEHLDDGPGGHG